MGPPLRAAEESHATEKWGLLKKLDLAQARGGDGHAPETKKPSAFRLRASAARTQAGLAWGALADRTSRVRLLAIGCAGWGVVSIFLGTATSYWQFALLKVLNGVALASIGPVAQSLIADFFPPTMRGEHFGWLQLFLCAGCILGALVGGSVASVPVTEGVKGWRLAFFSAGVLSLVAAALVIIVAKEPPRNWMASIGDVQSGTTEGIKEREGALCGLYQRCRNFCKAAVSRTFLLLLLQGVCGYIPLHAFQFYTLYFQYVGMPDWQASLLTACPLVGGLLGSLFGGWLGDQAERWNAFHGRPLVGQLGTLLALPLIYIGLLGIPRRPEFFGFYAIDMLFLGFAISWCPSGVNRPILSEIVEPDARATVFATQIAFEGSISAMLGSPVIALLAESIFGYRTGALPSHSAADHERNTEALTCLKVWSAPHMAAASLLFLFSSIVVFAPFVFETQYGLIHFTYPKDAIAYENYRLATSRRRASNASTADAAKTLQAAPSAAPLPEETGIPVKGRKAA
ncbi:hypothetical protein Emag_001831 [Eimeria magna]